MDRPPLTDEEGEVRELTADDFKLMKPLAEVEPGLAEAMQTMRNKGGRPKAETPKIHVGFRIAAEVAEGIKATGKGYNARVEAVLREALAKGLLNPQPAPQSDLLDAGKPKR
jgi:uncharacterized protein (DUF4415 family)